MADDEYRLLLMSDTHGELSTVDELAASCGANAVVHAGDFGFFDEMSVRRLGDRELRLHLLHGRVPPAVKDEARQAGRGRLEELVGVHPLSELPAYVRGERSFTVPVHAVPGNHEDLTVVEAFREGRVAVPGLTLLDERRVCRAGPFRIFGLGGNVLPGRKFVGTGPGGGGGKVWATLGQVGDLYALVTGDGKTGGGGGGDEDGCGCGDAIDVFVTHVSPGKEPIVALMAAHLGAAFHVSGHMGAPYCCVWNGFTVAEAGEAEAALGVAELPELKRLWEELRGRFGEGARASIERGLALLEGPPQARVRLKRGVEEPVWFRGGFNVNLPDAADGHALLVARDGRVALQTFSRGRRLPYPAVGSSC